MRELKERLTEVDRVEFPEELWSAALRRAAGEAVQGPVTPSPLRPAGRIAATAVAFAVFIAAAFFLWNAFESRSKRPRPGQTTPTPAAAVPGTCDYGPWMHECPEADWARSTLEAAGLTVVDELPASFVVQHADGQVNFWAMDPANHSGVQPLEEELKTSDPFQVVQQVDGVSVYHLRTWWVWTVHGLNVWVMVASGSDPSPEILEGLVRASIEVPY